jgi:hypothetical protein
MMATDRPSTEAAPKLRGAATEDGSGNIVDPADVSPRAASPKLSGKRVRGIPAVITKSGDRGTLIEVRPVDVSTAGGPELKHTLKFDTKREYGTLVVGDGNGQVPSDVAEFLTKNYPTSFEYVNEE